MIYMSQGEIMKTVNALEKNHETVLIKENALTLMNNQPSLHACGIAH